MCIATDWIMVIKELNSFFLLFNSGTKRTVNHVLVLFKKVSCFLSLVKTKFETLLLCRFLIYALH